MYSLDNKDLPKSCILSVKIPNSNEAGHALHLEVLFRDNKASKTYKVYPTEKQTGKKGLGDFTSKSIYRYDNWKESLHLEAQSGIDLCEILYESNIHYNTDQRQHIYNIVEKKWALVKERMKKNKKLKELKQDNIKNKYKDEIQVLNGQIRSISEYLNTLKKSNTI
ncbi:MAG: hypothetical protein WC934_06295 [Acidithiobacillus sp.]|uniref:hypothetical protein n=1 Tax=Acidithiobacillus sp. TaxID=1872118 RepID=UPI00355DA323